MSDSFASRVADRVARVAGSWRFIVIQTFFITVWIWWNVTNGTAHFDPYPFVLLNLCIGCQAAYTGPFVLMSASRQEAKDHELASQIYALEQRIVERDGEIFALLLDVSNRKEVDHVVVHCRCISSGQSQ